MARAFKHDQEKALRFRLTLLCMAVTSGKDGDLQQCTENILNYVSELIEPYSTTGKPKGATAAIDLRGALTDAAAHLAGAASAYRKHAARHRSVGRAVADPFFTTRATDFDKAVDRARAALVADQRDGRTP